MDKAAVLEPAIGLRQSGKYKKAIAVLKKLKSKQVSKQVCLLLVQLHNDLDQYALAIVEAKRTLVLFPKDFTLKCQLTFFIGVNYRKLNDEISAIEYLQQSLSIDSGVNNAEAVYNLAFLYIETKQLTAFEQVATRLLKWESYFLDTSLLRLDSAILQQDQCLLKERLLALQPYFSELDSFAIGKVAALLIDFKLDKVFDKLLSHHPIDSPIALSFEAKQLFESKNFIKTVSLLNEPWAKKQPKAALQYMLATAHHKLANYDEAFACYTAASKTKLREIEKLNVRYKDNLSKLVNFSKSTRSCSGLNKITRLTSNLGSNKANISFVLGFPRSGTTLLDNVLDTQKNILVFSESGVFKEVVRAYRYRLNKRYPEDILKLTANELSTLRNVFFHTIANMGFSIKDYSLIVEKNPSYSSFLPLIYAIFPEAKIIYMQRQPLDVCLSCFQQDFVMNNDNRKLITLNDIVERYIQSDAMVSQLKENLQLNFYEVRYEELVSNFNHVVAGIFNYLALSPDDSYLDFHQHAANKYVTSASRGQTRQPLHSASKNRWLAYQKYLQPFEKKLSNLLVDKGYKEQNNKA